LGHWQQILETDYELSKASSVLVGDFIIVLGGESWSLYSSNVVYQINLNSLEIIILGNLPTFMYGHKSVYFKNFIVSFGGGDTLGIIIRNQYAKNFLFLTSLEGFPCSRGSYFVPEESK
jgi:restriction endonuclease S subunit